MAGYKVQGKTADGGMVDIPLAATYDVAGNNILNHYAAKTEYEAIMTKLGFMGNQLDLLLASSGMVSFSDCDWATIGVIAESGKASSAFKVGDEKQIMLSTGEKITMVILGFDHDDLAEGGKVGITLGMKDCFSTAYPMNASNTNAGGWANSVMCQTTTETLYGYLPSDVQTVIKTVNKITAKHEQSGALETTSDKLFLFSQMEVMGNNKYSVSSPNSFTGEGLQYEYFKNASIPTPNSGSGAFSVLTGTGCFYATDASVASGYTNKFNQSRSTSTSVYYNYNNAKVQGDSATSACDWWLRSPCYGSSGSFCCISSSGNSGSHVASIGYGVAFGFCI